MPTPDPRALCTCRHPRSWHTHMTGYCVPPARTTTLPGGHQLMGEPVTSCDCVTFAPATTGSRS